MLALLKTYVVCLVTFLVVDGLWLGVIARDFYRTRLDGILSGRVVWPAAILFYLLFVAGLLYFVVQPALAAGSLRRLLFSAAFFGLCTYGAYDLTNWALTRDWPWEVSVVDMGWGACIATLTALAGWLVAR